MNILSYIIQKQITSFRKMLWILSGIILFYACENDLQHNLERYGKYITVNGFMSPVDTFRVNVSFSEAVNVLQNDSVINNAEVFLTLPDRTVLSLEPDLTKYGPYMISQKGYYRLHDLISFLPGEYQLTVNVPGHEPLVAKDSIPSPVPIDFCSFVLDSVSRKSFLLIGFRDPPGTMNYYSISLRAINYYTSYRFDRDSMGGGYYAQHKSILYNTYIKSDNSFIEATIPGGLRQIVFSDKNIPHSPEQTIVKIEHDLSQYNPGFDSIIFVPQLHSISRSYYNYAIGYFKQGETEEAVYTDPVNVYSNIQGGYGIFAGYSTAEKSIVYY